MFAYNFNDMRRDIELVRVSAAINSVPGFLALEEGVALMSLASSTYGSPPIVEVGSFKGRSTSFLAAGCHFAGRGRVYAVDHFRGSPEHQKGGFEETPEVVEAGTTLPEFRRSLSNLGLSGYVTEMVGSSRDMAKGWDKSIRLLFIDGEHSFEASSGDFFSWFPFVERGGIVCMHDYKNGYYLDGVTRFIDEVMLKMADLEHVARVRSLMIFRRR